MFKVIKDETNHGFTMTFENGYTISVRWGWGNYCDNRLGASRNPSAPPECENCETAVFTPDGEFISIEEYSKMGIDTYDEVFPYQTPEQVLELMNLISKL